MSYKPKEDEDVLKFYPDREGVITVMIPSPPVGVFRIKNCGLGTVIIQPGGIDLRPSMSTRINLEVRAQVDERFFCPHTGCAHLHGPYPAGSYAIRCPECLKEFKLLVTDDTVTW